MHAVARMILMLRPPGKLAEIDVIHDNAAWRAAQPKLSIAIPSFRHDASPLIDALARCERSGEVEIVLLDDGTRDDALTARLEAAANRAACPVRVVSAGRNRGRAAARNYAVSHTRSDWVLLLDADMAPDGACLLSNYLKAVEAPRRPSLVVGGYSLKQASRSPAFALHRWQAQRSECIPAAARAKSPGRHVFTSNVLAHREILNRYPFDEGFAGWGWEDVDWGLRIAAEYPVVHIDNTATHLGLDDDETLISKYTRSARNFARLTQKQGEEMRKTPLHRAAVLAKTLPFRSSLAALARSVALSKTLPLGWRGRALKALRALTYAEAL